MPIVLYLRLTRKGNKMFRIIHKTQGWVFASGFYTMDRVNSWIDNFNPAMWMDKTLTKDDLLVVEE